MRVFFASQLHGFKLVLILAKEYFYTTQTYFLKLYQINEEMANGLFVRITGWCIQALAHIRRSSVFASEKPNQAESRFRVIQPGLIFTVRISCSCFFNKDAGEFGNAKPAGKKPAFAKQSRE